MGKVSREEMQRRYQAFAVAYATPGTPAYRNGSQAWIMAINPEASESAAVSGATRYLRESAVQAAIAAVRATAGIKEATTLDIYIRECFENERRLLASGERGAPMAAVKYRELAGKALGYLVNIKRDDTPRQPQERLPRSKDELLQIAAKATVMAELMEPMPLPAGETEAVDYEVVGGDDAA